MNKLLSAAAAVAITLNAATSLAEIRISEWMYSGNGGEFIELTNVGGSPVDMTGWSYDDDSRMPGEFDLSAFGTVQPGETVIITEDPAEVFRTAWGLSPGLKIIGDLGLENANGLGRNDSLVLFDADNGIVDQLNYGDEDFPGSIRTQDASGWVSGPAAAQDDALAWTLSSAADAQASYVSSLGDIGNPGTFTPVGALPGGLPSLVITEYMYSGEGDEFVEFTNLSGAPVDVTGWSFDDNNFGGGDIAPFDISAFGVIAAGESVVLAAEPEAAFRLDWGLDPAVKVIGDFGLANGGNIGRNDEINIYDDSDALVDRLTYGDGDIPGTIRTQEISGTPLTFAALGANDATQWVFSSVGDVYGSYASLDGDVGNPGSLVPEPSTALLAVFAAAGLGWSVRRRK